VRNWLIAIEWITEDQKNDRRAIAEAIAEGLEEAARTRLKNL
jgi:hypothetical protein